MRNPEQTPPAVSRTEQLHTLLEQLRNIRSINQSDPAYAAEIASRIEEVQAELAELTETGQ